MNRASKCSTRRTSGSIGPRSRSMGRASDPSRDTALLTARGQPRLMQGRRKQRLHETRHRTHVGPFQLPKQTMRARRQPHSERRAGVAIPRLKQLLAEPLTLPLGRDHHIHAPRCRPLRCHPPSAAPASSRTVRRPRPCREPPRSAARASWDCGGTATPSVARWHRRARHRTHGGTARRRPALSSGRYRSICTHAILPGET